MTVADVVLLPINALDWPADTLQAVLAHEQAHVVRRDFAILIASQVNRALFWFSPVAWWQHRRLVALTELASDDQVIAASGDRLRYAEILLEMGRRAGPVSQGPAMARPATLSRRIDRILRRPVPSGPAGKRQQAMLVAGVADLSLAAASTVPHPASQPTMVSYLRGWGASDAMPQSWDDEAPTALPMQQAATASAVPEPDSRHTVEPGAGSSSAVSPQAAATAGTSLPITRTPQQASRRAVRPVSRTVSPPQPMTARTVQEASGRSRQDSAIRPTEPVMEQRGPKFGSDGEASTPKNGVAIDPVQLLPSVGTQPRFPVQILPPEFAAVIGSTCSGTIAIGQNAQPDKQPSVIAGQLVPARAQFHYRTGGVP